MPADFESRVSACAAGLALMRKWSSQRTAAMLPGVSVSAPYLVIDDGWLEAEPDAAPPHVYVCIAASKDELGVEHEPAQGGGTPFPGPLAQMLAPHEAFYRIGGAFDGEPGAWLIRPAVKSPPPKT